MFVSEYTDAAIIDVTETLEYISRNFQLPCIHAGRRNIIECIKNHTIIEKNKIILKYG
ncbi:hypothetical protein AGMMS49928_27510 [Spirochaetia bacterium]|nr:hypothetical protein AGMMS49928_27510 [Spirochaetia bacterium]